MARYTDAKCRLCRREGIKLFLKGERCYSPKCPIERKGAVPPGQHGPRLRKRLSEYGQQLREKQKARRLYGILEKQFRRYIDKASKNPQVTGEVLFQLLESRLDNVVYRSGLAPSRSIARQLVSHGHAYVNEKKVNIASYQVKPGDLIRISEKAMKIAAVEKNWTDRTKNMPKWLQRKGPIGKMMRLPKREEIEAAIDDKLIIEYYSR
ncbi:MAG TPA: 30S ribosomal protein S4 [Patescibacteria group bacterium]|nr:30S ribosomal protein S4 [Patescibacteria group bacterium]